MFLCHIVIVPTGLFTENCAFAKSCVKSRKSSRSSQVGALLNFLIIIDLIKQWLDF